MSYTDQSSRRIHLVRKAMADQNLDSFLVTDRANIGWLTGFTGSSGYVLLLKSSELFATDSRYTEQAANQCPGWQISKLASSSPEEIISLFSNDCGASLGFESGNVTHANFSQYEEKVGAGVTFIPTTSLIDSLRMVKDSDEVNAIRIACGIADKAFSHIKPFIKPGVSERDLMIELETYMRREHGADIAFDTIVASGWRSALPHGIASSKIVEFGDSITFDFGAKLNSYCSDITRTVMLGACSDKQKIVYDTVQNALYSAIDAIKPGIEGVKIDAIARKVIGDAGFGEYFGHGLGHSLGRNVHDGPGFSPKSRAIMEPGMVITVEPGIYIPGEFGVRIEHDIVVTESGCEILDSKTTDLTIV